MKALENGVNIFGMALWNGSETLSNTLENIVGLAWKKALKSKTRESFKMLYSKEREVFRKRSEYYGKIL